MLELDFEANVIIKKSNNQNYKLQKQIQPPFRQRAVRMCISNSQFP